MLGYYYNIIPAFGIGGLIGKIASAAGHLKLRNYANLLSKSNPVLSGLLRKLSNAQKNGTKLAENELKELVTLAQNYRRNDIRYLSRRVKINEKLAAKRLAAELAAAQAAAPTTAAQAAAQAAAPTTAAQAAAQAAAPTTAAQAAAVKKTLKDYFGSAKKLINNNPKTTLAAIGLGLGTGPGRYILGKTISATQSSPDTWFNDAPSTDNTLYVNINGQKVPIKQGSNGVFEIANNDSNLQSTDNIDAIINGVSSANLLGVSSQANPSYQLSDSDLELINQLFSDDQ